jgi:hypothetical protein
VGYIPFQQENIDAFNSVRGDYFLHFARAIGGWNYLSYRALIRGVAASIGNRKFEAELLLSAFTKLFFSYQANFYIFEVRREEFSKEEEPRLPNALGVQQTTGDLIAMTAVFGHKKMFETVVKFCLDMHDKEMVGGYVTSLTQLFIIQLAEQELGLTPRAWLNDGKKWSVDPCEKEPLFAQILQHWADEDTAVLEPLLIQLLNRHTFQASKNNKDGGKDFSGLDTEQFPLELFFLYRLRQWRGLSIPNISHRLTEAPFDKLPEPATNLIFDEETKKLMNRIRFCFPDFDSYLREKRIRDWECICEIK